MKKLVLTSCRVADVLSCGVRACKALFYKASAGSDFLSGSVKWCGFLRKWCSGMTSEDTDRDEK